VAGTVALPSVDYTRRDPAGDVLYRVVRDHLQTFLAEAAHLRDGEGVPRFVAEEFQEFLEVSRLARNSADWHRLLEICALTDTLILDETGFTIQRTSTTGCCSASRGP
jgi:hypothetical protein